MNIAMVWIIYIVSFVIGVYLLYKATGTYKLLTIPIVFFAFYFVFIYMGSPFLFIQRGMTNIKYLVATNAAAILIPLGMLLANRMLGFVPARDNEAYNAGDITGQQLPKWVKILWLVATAASLIVSIAYMLQLHPIPLFYGITNPGSNIEVTALRQQATKDFAGYKWYQIAIELIMPFLTTLLFMRYQQTGAKKLLALFIPLAMWNILMLMLATEKAPAAYFILTMLVVYFIAQKKIKIRGIVVALIMIAAVNYFITYMAYSNGVVMPEGPSVTDMPNSGLLANEALQEATEEFKRFSFGLLNRLTMAQSVGLYYYLKIFPDIHEFVGFKIVPNPLNLPYEYFNTSRYVYSVVYPNLPYKGTMPTAFFGDIYVGFGYIAMLAGMLIMGFLMQAVEIYFKRSPKTLLNASFYAFVFLLFGKMGITDFFSAVLNTGTILLFATYLAFKYAAGERLDIKQLWHRPALNQ